MDVELFVDGEEVPLKEFVVRILAGMVTGAVSSLNDVKKDWKEIHVKVRR